MNLLYYELTDGIIGACMEVHTILGCGLYEAVYSEALCFEFQQRGIPFLREAELPIIYKGKKLDKKYRVDFLCYDKIILELKATEKILPIHVHQLINYLKLSGIKVGYVMNFGAKSFEYKRIGNLYQKSSHKSV